MKSGSYKILWKTLIILMIIEFVSSAVKEGKVVGGTKVNNRTNVAFMVSLRRRNGFVHYCGGSIIHEKIILTAAHCGFPYIKEPENICAIVGDLNIGIISFISYLHVISKILIHDKYIPSVELNDIGLMKVKTPFELNSFTNKIAWATEMPADGTKCTIYGWGMTNTETQKSTKHLMKADLPIIKNKVCSFLYCGQIQKGMFCAGYITDEEPKRDACQGDSGGPLVCYNKVAGIVSWGVGCAQSYFPGVYTQVPFYNNWIETAKTELESRSSVLLASKKNTMLIFLILHINLNM